MTATAYSLTPDEIKGRMHVSLAPLALEEGENDVLQLAAEVIARMSPDEQRWLLESTYHLFVIPHRETGRFHHIPLPEPMPEDRLYGFPSLRLIALSPRLLRLPRDGAMYAIAHEIGHSFASHLPGDYDDHEAEADRHAAAWGFPRPPDTGTCPPGPPI